MLLLKKNNSGYFPQFRLYLRNIGYVLHGDADSKESCQMQIEKKPAP